MSLLFVFVTIHRIVKTQLCIYVTKKVRDDWCHIETVPCMITRFDDRAVLVFLAAVCFDQFVAQSRRRIVPRADEIRDGSRIVRQRY